MDAIRGQEYIFGTLLKGSGGVAPDFNGASVGVWSDAVPADEAGKNDFDIVVSRSGFAQNERLMGKQVLGKPRFAIEVITSQDDASLAALDSALQKRIARDRRVDYESGPVSGVDEDTDTLRSQWALSVR